MKDALLLKCDVPVPIYVRRTQRNLRHFLPLQRLINLTPVKPLSGELNIGKKFGIQLEESDPYEIGLVSTNNQCLLKVTVRLLIPHQGSGASYRLLHVQVKVAPLGYFLFLHRLM